MVGIAIPSVTVPPHVLEMILNRQLFFSNISEGRLRRAHVAFADLFRHFLSYPVEYNDFADTESDDGWVGMEEQEREEYKRKRNSARACKVCSGILHLCTLVCRHFAESNNALAGNHPQPAFFRQVSPPSSPSLVLSLSFPTSLKFSFVCFQILIKMKDSFTSIVELHSLSWFFFWGWGCGAVMVSSLMSCIAS